MRSRVVLALILLCGSVVIIGGVADASTSETAPRYGSVTASSIAIDAETEQKYLDAMQDFADQFGLETRDDAFLLTKGDKTWLVFTDQEPKTGEATVKGTIAVEATSDQRGAIFADSVSFNQDGERATLADVRDNPEKYDGKFVKVTTSYRQLAYVVDGSKAATQRNVAGRLGGSSGGLLNQPGASGRWTIRELSADDDRWSVAQMRLGPTEKTVTTIGWNRNRWWIDAKTTVNAVVVNTGGKAMLVVAKTNVGSTSLDSVSEIDDRGEQLEGKVVTVKAQTVGTKISSQELLLSLAKCAPESVPFPATGCMPVPVDATVHAGVLFEGVPQSFNDVVVYAGVSNHHQQKVMKSQRGTYRVTGRVIATEQIDPNLPDGYALLVYDMERTDGLHVGQKARKQADSYRADAVTQIRSQINGSSGQESTATATAANGSASGDSSTAAAAGSDGNNSDSGSDSADGAQITIVSAELKQKSIESGETAVVTVILENTGTQAGTRTVEVEVDTAVVTAEKVRLSAGESRTVSIEFTVSTIGRHSVFAGQQAGTLTVNEPGIWILNQGQQTILGWFIGLSGIVLVLSSIVLEILRGLKKHREGVVEMSDRPALLMLFGGGLSLITMGALVPNSEGGALGVLFGGPFVIGPAATFGVRSLRNTIRKWRQGGSDIQTDRLLVIVLVIAIGFIAVGITLSGTIGGAIAVIGISVLLIELVGVGLLLAYQAI